MAIGQISATFSWWHWHFHPDVVLGVLLLEGVYLLGIGPLRRRCGWAPTIEPRRIVLFTSGIAVLYVTLSSSLHELADQFLFSAHMVQHLLLIMVVAPLLLLGTPGWLLRPLLRGPRVLSTARFLTHPVIAFLLFSAVLSAWHLPLLYEAALRHQWVHILQHLMFIASSVIMWWPVLSPLPEVPRASYLVQILYLFFLSLPPGFVGAAITFSNKILYPWYATAPRLWGITPIVDQQIAGLIMKVPGALGFMGVMIGVFFAWFSREERSGQAEGQPLPDEPPAKERLAARE